MWIRGMWVILLAEIMLVFCQCSGTITKWSCFYLGPSWAQSGFVWCLCSVKLFMVNRRITSSLQHQGLSNRTSQVLNGRGCSSFSHFAILFLWQESSEGQLTLLGDVRLENKTLQAAFLGRLKKKRQSRCFGRSWNIWKAVIFVIF